MLKAFQRLFLITFIFLIGFQLSLFLIRKVGEKRNAFPPSKRASLLNQKNMIFLHGGRSDLYPFQSQKALLSAIQNPTLFLAIDLHYDQDLRWKISSVKKNHYPLSKKNQKNKKQKATMDLKHFLNLYPEDKPLLLKIFTFEQKALFQLLNTLHYRLKKNKMSPLIIESPFSKALKILKKNSPQLLFTSHPSALTQVQLMSSLFIETLYQPKFDFFILSPKENPPPRALKQIKKKQKKSFLKIKTMKEYKAFPFKDFLNGIYIDEPKLFFKNCFKLKIIKMENLLEACE